MNDVELTFLGTCGWYDSAAGNTVCALVRTPECDIVLDAGNGLYKLSGYRLDRPVYLILSHFHLDHTEGLHTLCRSRFEKGLFICGPEGVGKYADILLDSPFSVKRLSLPFKTDIIELPGGADLLPFGIKALPMVHSDPVLGYRFLLRGKSLAFITDTGYCDNALALARGADTLICECSHLPGEKNPGWPHFNPEEAAELALNSGAGRLIMTHFDSSRYPTAESRAAAVSAAKKIFANTVAAYDGMKIIL